MNRKTLKPIQVFHILLTVVIMVFIFIQSALPAELSQKESGVIVGFLAKLFQTDAETMSFLVRKTAHFLEYTILGASLVFTVQDLRMLLCKPSSLEISGKEPQRRAVPEGLITGLIAWLIGAIYAVTDEFHQMFSEGRSCEFRDMLIDFGGVLVGILIVFLIRKLCHQRRVCHQKSI